jgi:hypothetical protein
VDERALRMREAVQAVIRLRQWVILLWEVFFHLWVDPPVQTVTICPSKRQL